ncbi:MAG: FlgD immunoglobulin-like domain containing protein [Candidatus Cloacimonadaceae bacterium]|nr:FlgD immunoglobulin-like domain containing protein [Candidatus Cloacimonadaceae bacterium]
MNRHLSLLILAAILPFLMYAVTLSVKQDGSGDYSAIQAALDVANPGDTVLVHPGRYFENLTMLTNNITLMSLEGTTGVPSYIDSTIIDGNHANPCLRIPQGNVSVIIRGFSITNGFRTGSGGGLVISAGNAAEITNCKVFNNVANNGAGIYLTSANVTFSGVDVFNNYSVNLGGGLYSITAPGSTNSISFDQQNRCSIYNNRAGAGQDIYINLATEDIYVYLDTFSVASYTNYYAVYLSDNQPANQIQIDILNAYHQEVDNDLYVSTIGDNENDGLSPATALKTIHEAIYRVASDSLNQRTVHILPGDYSRTDNDQIFPIALKRWVIVQGSGTDATTIIGEPHPLIPMGYGYADRVFMSHGEPSVKLSNMTITTRNTNNGCAVNGRKLSTINLHNIHISGVMPNHDAAISLWTSSQRETIWSNLTIENETTSLRGLVDVNGAMSGKISNSNFRNATSIYTSSSVRGSSLVSFVADKQLEFENCIFDNLTVYDDDTFAIAIGGVQYPQQQNHISFKNCLFSNVNTQNEMIGIASYNNPRIDITNCTFAGNQGNAYTLMVNGDVNIVNSIFDNDTPYQIKVNPMDGNPDEQTTLTIDHSLVKDAIAGILPFPVPGNTINFLPSSFSGDPLFAGGFDIHDPLYYSLAHGSPCINTGTPDTIGLYLPLYDLAGNWRVWNGRIDMGCFEFGSEPWVSNDDPVVPDLEQVTLIQNYPNPFNPTTTISFSIPAGMQCSLDIYNLRGQRVKTLLDEKMIAGKHSITWNGDDDNGRKVTSGVYIYRLNTPNSSKAAKMLLMK